LKKFRRTVSIFEEVTNWASRGIKASNWVSNFSMHMCMILMFFVGHRDTLGLLVC
jgi:hypothetical protein